MVFIINAERALKDISLDNIHTSQFSVIEALYGTTNDKQFDITTILNDKIINNQLVIVADNGIAGDPDPGTGKNLWLTYQWEGKLTTKKYNEHDIIKLPE